VPSPSPFGRQESGGVERPAPAETPSQPPPGTDPALLEKVLQHTSEIGNSNETIDPNEMKALQEVVRHYQGKPLTLQPIAEELVGAVLRSHFPAQCKSDEFRAALSAEIAQSLMEDPLAQDRMAALWHRLGGDKT